MDLMAHFGVLEGEYTTSSGPYLTAARSPQGSTPRGTMVDDHMRSIIQTNFPGSILAIENYEVDQYPGGDNQLHDNINTNSPAISPNTILGVVVECLDPQPVKHSHIRYSSSDWVKKKTVLETLYITVGCTQQEVVNEMAKEDFYISVDAFKRKCDEWGWVTYKASGSRKRPRKPSTRIRKSQKISGTNLSSPITVASVDDSINQSSPDTIAARSPNDFLLLPARIWLPPRISDSPHHVVYESLLRSVKDLYVSHLSRWKVHNHSDVEEDEHDDLLTGIGVSLRSLESPDKSFSHKGIHKAFQTLKKVVGTKKSEGCGFFSLPAILQAYLRLRESNQLLMAKFFLSNAIKYAKQKYPMRHPFVKVLLFLQQFRCFQELEESQEYQRFADFHRIEDLIQRNFEVLKIIIFSAYQTCVDVAKQLGGRNLSYLQLWGDFVVYGDKSSAHQAKEALDDLRRHVRNCDEENNEYDDYTMKLLGMSLYVLQSTPSMAAEAEAMAVDMVRRLDNRVREGGKLEGEMLIIWKDLRHTLGNFHHARQQYQTAIWYLEIYLLNGVEDERDLFALKKLEEWYADLGDLIEVERVYQWRLWEEKKQMAGVSVEKLFDENFDGTSDEGTLGSNSEDGGNLSNEDTVVGEVDGKLCAVLEENEILEGGNPY